MTTRSGAGGRREVSADRWRRIATLLDAIIDLPPDGRGAALEAACGGDGALRAEVEAYLRAGDTAGDFLETPAAQRAALLVAEIAADPAPAVGVGARVGPWRLEREIARGGMGVVWLAARADGEFEQQVALKVLKRGLDTDEILRRFLRERQILARLQHPGIARLVDGGATDDGRPYFAMEHVDGRPITDDCAARGAGLVERLRLVRAVCDAVQYAHGNLVVHRDLKPSNVLVTADGGVKLLDFGIARLLDAPEGEAALTRTGRHVMTPQYAAPEQVRGGAVTTATDVYALGLVLYELIAGRPPYAVEGPGAAALERAVLDTTPEPPSRVAARGAVPAAGAPASGAENAAPVAARLPGRLRGDLDAIVMTALRKEPARRYPTAEALGEDLERLLRGLPVRARRDTVGYRARKFVLRHRAGVATAALALLALCAGLAGTLWQAGVARREARRAEEVRDFLVGIFAVSDPSQSRGEAVTARELLDRGAERIGGGLGDQPALRADLLGVLADVYQNLGLPDRALPLAEQALAIERVEHGDDSDAAAAAFRRLGAALFAKGRYAEAEAAQRQALERHGRRHGATSGEAAGDMEDLAATLRAAGRIDEAGSLVRDVLETRRRLSRGDSPELATAINNAGMMARESGRFDEAEARYREAIDMRRRVLGPDHPDLAGTLGNLAAVLRQRGRLEEAEAAAREALAIDIKLYGEDNPNTIAMLNTLGAITQSLGRYDEAEALDRRVLDFWRRQGEDHPNAVVSLNNLATVLKDRGDYAAAEPLFRRLAETFPRVLGEKHPFTAVSLTHLGVVLREQEDDEGAAAALDRALAIVRGLRGDDHPDTAGVMAQKGVLEQQRGNLGEAERLLRRALAIREQALGPDNPATAAGRLALAGLLRERGALDEAEALGSAALLALRTAMPGGHPDIAVAAMELGRTETARGAFDRAGELLREAAAIRAERFGATSWKTAEARVHLAAVLAATGRVAEARALLEPAAGTLRDQRGAGHRLARAAAAALRRLPAS